MNNINQALNQAIKEAKDALAYEMQVVTEALYIAGHQTLVSHITKKASELYKLIDMLNEE